MEPNRQNPTRQNLELRSDQIQDLLSEPPSSILRWSNLLIAAVIVVGCLLTWFIKHPSVIAGQAVITSEKPPIKVNSRTTGQIEQVLVANGTRVEEGQTIIRLAGSIPATEMIALKQYLDEVAGFLDHPTDIDLPKAVPLFNLNEAQSYYNSLLHHMADFQKYKAEAAGSHNLGMLNDKVREYEQILKISEEERALLVQEIETAKKQFEMQKKEYELGYISEADYLKSDMARLQAEIRLKGVDKGLIQNKLTLNDYKRQLNESINSLNERQRETLQNINGTYAMLATQLAQWEKTVTVASPIAGTLNFTDQLADKQYITGGTSLFTVIPDDRNLVVNAKVADTGVAELRPGQTAKLSFAIYPSSTYGYVEGKVQSISTLPEDGQYNLSIALTHGLKTDYGNTLAYRPEMKASLEIFTEEKRLFTRIFGSLLK